MVEQPRVGLGEGGGALAVGLAQAGVDPPGDGQRHPRDGEDGEQNGNPRPPSDAGNRRGDDALGHGQPERPSQFGLLAAHRDVGDEARLAAPADPGQPRRTVAELRRQRPEPCRVGVELVHRAERRDHALASGESREVDGWEVDNPAFPVHEEGVAGALEGDRVDQPPERLEVDVEPHHGQHAAVGPVERGLHRHAEHAGSGVDTSRGDVQAPLRHGFRPPPAGPGVVALALDPPG